MVKRGDGTGGLRADAGVDCGGLRWAVLWIDPRSPP